MAWTADFLAEIRGQANFPRLIFTLDGVGYEEEVVHVSQIVRNTNLSAGTVTVRMANSSKAFNSRIADNTWDQQRAYIRIYFEDLASEKMNLFAGIVTKVVYEGADAIFYVRDHMAQMLNREVGDWENEEDYYSIAYNPADLVWAILTDTNYGNLDDTASSANTDIDYTQWAAWKTDMTDTAYSIKGRFVGQTIRDILLKVCMLTDSYIYVDGDGLFQFVMHDGNSQPLGSENYTSDNIFPENETSIPFLTIDIDDIRNQITSWHSYDPASENSTGASGTDSTSVASYGTFRAVERDNWLWHADSSSCSAFRTAYLQRYAYPYRQVEFMTTMASWLESLGTKLGITNSHLGMSTDYMTLMETILYPSPGPKPHYCHMKLYWDWD